MRRVLALVVLALPACSAPPRSDALSDPGVAVVWNRVEEPRRVCESLSGRKQFFDVRGCARWSEPAAQGGPRICSIYAPAPRNERDLERFATLGHELMHCFDGHWHDRWGRMNPPAENAAAAGSEARLK